MDIFRLNLPSDYVEDSGYIMDFNPNEPYNYNAPPPSFGEVINGIRSKTWIERYRDAGEFTLVAKASSDVKDRLPVGSFISHVDTAEVMIVENHEINEADDKETEVTITGRSFETIFENRIVGSNYAFFPTLDTVPADYVLGSNYTPTQAIILMREHVLDAYLVDDNNEFPHCTLIDEVPAPGDLEDPEARTMSKGTLYARLLELLEIDNIGIKIVRPGPLHTNEFVPENILVKLHKGDNVDVEFSYLSNDIKSADYFWSNRKTKNAAYVYGRWMHTFVTTSSASITNRRYNRQVMVIDASDLDSSLSAAPTGATRTNIRNAMNARGWQALRAQKNIVITKAELRDNRYYDSYRKDFNVGDVVRVTGNYNTNTSMRVSEFVEVEDENGVSGYPTLAIP